LPGNPRCCCVRVCQSPVLTGALAGGAPVPIGRGVPLQEVAAHEGAVRARRGDRRALRHRSHVLSELVKEVWLMPGT
jgi:hypothetical protein